MSWYKTGTVAVTQNSNAVIGTGTAFIANSRVGDGFRGPDGRWYEVTNIASNAALSITPNYEGPTVADGFYAIMPVQGYQKDLSDQVRAILNVYGEKLAALGTTGNYEILPPSKGGTGIIDLSVFMQGVLNDGDGPAARSTLGAAKSGANNDITSLAGMTTALSISQGGTGGLSAAEARTNLGVVLLGTVSQTAGVPTGAIMSRSLDPTSGDLTTKYANGQMIVYGTRQVNQTVAAGGFAAPSIAKSADFIGGVSVFSDLAFFTGANTGGNQLYASRQSVTPAGAFLYAGAFINMGRTPNSEGPNVAIGTSAAASYFFWFTAIGRWF